MRRRFPLDPAASCPARGGRSPPPSRRVRPRDPGTGLRPGAASRTCSAGLFRSARARRATRACSCGGRTAAGRSRSTRSATRRTRPTASARGMTFGLRRDPDAGPADGRARPVRDLGNDDLEVAAAALGVRRTASARCMRPAGTSTGSSSSRARATPRTRTTRANGPSGSRSCSPRFRTDLGADVPMVMAQIGTIDLPDVPYRAARGTGAASRRADVASAAARRCSDASTRRDAAPTARRVRVLGRAARRPRASRFAGAGSWQLRAASCSLGRCRDERRATSRPASATATAAVHAASSTRCRQRARTQDCDGDALRRRRTPGSSRPARPCAAARRSRARSSPARRARPRAPPGAPSRNRSAEPKCRSSARRRAGPTPWRSSKIESRAARLAALAVEAEREAVRLVADPLEQLEPGECAVEHDRVGPAGDEHLLLALRERDHGDARQVVGLHRRERRRELALAAVDRRRGSAPPRTTRRSPRSRVAAAARSGARRPPPSPRSRPARSSPRTPNFR